MGGVAAASERSRCPRCGVSFRCGVHTDACWCTALPPIDPQALAGLDAPARAALGLPAGPFPRACLCRACLAALAAALDAGPAADENAGRAGNSPGARTRAKETPEP